MMSSSSKITSACDLLDAQMNEANEESQQHQTFPYSAVGPYRFEDAHAGLADVLPSFDDQYSLGSISSSLPGDPYAQNDYEATRGADPCAFLHSQEDQPFGDSVPFWASFGDVLSGGEQLFRNEDPVFGAGKKHSMITANLPEVIEQEIQQEVPILEEQKFYFDSSTTSPPVPPASSCFEMRDTTIYAATQDAAAVGNRLLDFCYQKNADLVDLKGKQEKCTLKVTVVSSQTLKEVTLKVRMYDLNDVVALEFQRQAGDAFEFSKIYNQALEFFTTQKPVFFAVSSSRSELATPSSSSSTRSAKSAVARATTSAAHAAMTTAVLPSVEEMEIESDCRLMSDAIESLLHQASSSCDSVNPEGLVEAVSQLALLAEKLTAHEMGMLMMRLTEEEPQEVLEAFEEKRQILRRSSLSYHHCYSQNSMMQWGETHFKQTPLSVY